VYLTLDQKVQYFVENALDAAMEEHQAKAAWAIVQRVETGEILAMAVRPAYDLNEYGKTPLERQRNEAAGHVYEPGSTFKGLVFSAALNEGVIHPDDLIDCENGCWYYGGRPLRDFHAYDVLSTADVLKKSSNIGTAKIALKLGNRRVYDYLQEFGIGKRSGIDLPGEEVGILHDPKNWSKICITRIAMGHSVSVTALQILNAYCCIANGGFLMRPYVVQRVVGPDGTEILVNEPTVASRPIRQETARLMCKLLARVSEDGGTARRARVEGYSVAGKTGTATKTLPTGGYSTTDHMASFVGFLPADRPEIGIIVVVDTPQPKHTGGQVAAPVFREIAEQAVRYLDVPPTDSNLSFAAVGP
jgi:cell division protein FtsI (penicillin-binding protein 3)